MNKPIKNRSWKVCVLSDQMKTERSTFSCDIPNYSSTAVGSRVDANNEELVCILHGNCKTENMEEREEKEHLSSSSIKDFLVVNGLSLWTSVNPQEHQKWKVICPLPHRVLTIYFESGGVYVLKICSRGPL